MSAMQHQSPYGSGVDSTSFTASPAAAAAQVSAQAAKQSAHQRTYQACIPCRNRKVRCDLGAVDNPHDPPCSRCRRESKDCYFSLTRRKKKSLAQPDDLVEQPDDEEQEADSYTIKTGRKRVRAPAAPDQDIKRPRTPGGSFGSTRPLRRPDGGRTHQYAEEDIKASEQTTAILQGAEVHGGHDALKVLMEAAGIRGRTGSSTSTARPHLNGPSPASLPAAVSPVMDKNAPNQQDTKPFMPSQQDTQWTQKHADPTTSPFDLIPPDTPGYALAVKAWTRFRFVRAGWFTPKEGIAYVAYFYKYLSPLTPITLPDFFPVDRHEQMLTTEPMLSITILLISSRHMRLEGPGAMSRPYTIHQKLWTYLQGMIDRVTWGQEQFGVAISQPGCDVNPLTRKGLRTLGTVESLMLLTEWHPRAMHFPPDEADDELMIPNEPLATPDPESDDSAKGIGGQRMDSWLDPCWRSDRMCWMLLGMAMSLAFEIGVFDKSEWQRHALDATRQSLSVEEMQLYDKRRANVRDLLLVYVTMTSGRLGLTSMLPSNYSKPEDSELYKTQDGDHATIQERVLQFWLRIAAIMRDGNKKIFANKSFTRDLIKNGSYKIALEQFAKPLADWRRDLDSCVLIPKYMRYMLEIEYEYCRVYLNALSLQAVAERCANEFPKVNDPPMDLSRPSSITTNGVSTDVAIKPQTLSKWLGGDRVFMDEVRNAACNLLTIVVEGLYPGEYLRHAPVRSYFRIISVAIMLLKSFSLGASEADVADSINLMDRTVAALRTCIVDDVHVASRFADLLATLTQNLKPRLVRISADGRDARSRKQSVRSTPVSGVDISSANAFAVSNQPLTNPNLNGLSTALQNQWSYDQVARNGYGQQNVLSGISESTYDLTGNHEYSIMPPPSYAFQSPSNDNSANNGVLSTLASTANGSVNQSSTNATTFPTGAGFNGGIDAVDACNSADDPQDWLALPLDPLLSMTGVDVNQTMYGPELDGYDMLELLLNNHQNTSTAGGFQ